MKKVANTLLILCLAFSAWTMTIPRVYFQKVVLANGKLPRLTTEKKLSAKEYIFTADILETNGDVLSTERNPVNTVTFKYVGDGKNLEKTAIVSVQLGNFQNQWKAGQTLHLVLTHRATKKKLVWDIYIPEGTATINYLKQPVKLPKEITK
jgi:hypothetical protein